MLQVIVVEFQLHHKTSQYNNTASGSNDGYVWTPSADLCASVTVPAEKMVSLQTRTCSRVAVWY